eukprot:TRINITY_DN195_c0_g1_i13.p1 TRINITY_DN195_c0_g1~~TRINITY_DN195_c0_g1_i13.p1  ORF type:complete len:165 (+),score=30.81 TRINITY_DN195_c0_g1_i13:481-975(+)
MWRARCLTFLLGAHPCAGAGSAGTCVEPHSVMVNICVLTKPAKYEALARLKDAIDAMYTLLHKPTLARPANKPRSAFLFNGAEVTCNKDTVGSFQDRKFAAPTTAGDYFAVLIESVGKEGAIGIGLAPPHATSAMPGWNPHSYTYTQRSTLCVAEGGNPRRTSP